MSEPHVFRVLFKDRDRMKRLEEEVPSPWSAPGLHRPFEVKIADEDDAAMVRIRFAAEIEAAAVWDANVLSMNARLGSGSAFVINSAKVQIVPGTTLASRFTGIATSSLMSTVQTANASVAGSSAERRDE